MPIIKSAIKKLRVDKKRTATNLPVKSRAKSALKLAKAQGGKEAVAQAYSAMDLAIKHKLMTKNTVARLKSRLVAMLKSKAKPNPFAK